MKAVSSLLIVLMLSGCTQLAQRPETRMRYGQGEIRNHEQVKNTEIRQTVPVMDILIPISKGLPRLPVLTLELVGQGIMSVSDGDTALNVREGFAGVNLSHERGRIGLMGNDRDYVITLEGYHQLTNLLSVTGEIQHRSAHEFESRAERRKETKTAIGLRYQVNECWQTGLGYETGNIGSGGVRDNVFFELVWEGC